MVRALNINEAMLQLLLELVVLCLDVKTALDPTCDLTNISQLIYVNKAKKDIFKPGPELISIYQLMLWSIKCQQFIKC